MIKELKTSLRLLAFFTVLTGLLYPLAVTGIAKGLFPGQATGTLLKGPAGFVGSALIGQKFDDPKFLWGRPSATSPAYNAAASSGSNLGPLNPALLDQVKERIEALKAADPGNKNFIPIDLVTSSASGLDPHISPAAADYQAGRIARAGGIPIETVRKAIVDHTQGPTFSVLGEARVNVLEVNISLSRLYDTK